jgi:hypothetical protein
LIGVNKSVKFVVLTNQYLQAMKTVKEKIKDSYALPGKPMTQAEFEAHIKEAEKGSFVTLEEGNREFEAWKKARKK